MDYTVWLDEDGWYLCIGGENIPLGPSVGDISSRDLPSREEAERMAKLELEIRSIAEEAPPPARGFPFKWEQ